MRLSLQSPALQHRVLAKASSLQATGEYVVNYE